jgi:ankyrin repeat protein
MVGCNSSPQTAQEPAKGMPASEQKIVAQKPPSPSAPPIASAAVTRRKPATVTPEEARKKLEELGVAYEEKVFLASASDGKADVVEFFLAAGMNPNVKDAATWTGLMLGAEKGHSAVIQALVDGGADLEVKDREGNTALTWGAGEGKLEAVKTLIAAGANVNTENVSGMSPLARALLFNRADVADELRKSGAKDPRRQ